MHEGSCAGEEGPTRLGGWCALLASPARPAIVAPTVVAERRAAVHALPVERATELLVLLPVAVPRRVCSTQRLGVSTQPSETSRLQAVVFTLLAVLRAEGRLINRRLVCCLAFVKISVFGFQRGALVDLLDHGVAHRREAIRVRAFGS